MVQDSEAWPDRTALFVEGRLDIKGYYINFIAQDKGVVPSLALVTFHLMEKSIE